MRRAFAAAFLAVLASVPLHAQSPTPDPRAAAQESLLRADARWSDTTARGGLPTGFTSMLAEDAVYLHPGADAVRGRAAIRAFLAAQPATAGTVLRWQALRSAVSGDGASGYTTGVSHVVVAGADGAPETRFGSYVTFWRRGGDGQWAAVATMHARPPLRDPLRLPAGWRRAAA
ncbi:MAG: hypothetical protein JWM27_935, partial [Gemmatimonadetes bacterium]|nr:hypothetical protein [Gemmatimonadota bacterium]